MGFQKAHANEGAQIVKVGYIPGFGTIRDLDSINKKGYVYDILKRSEYYSNYVFEFVKYDNPSSLVLAIESKEIDLLAPAFLNVDHTSRFVFSDIQILTTQVLLAAKSSAAPYYYNDPASIDNKVVATYYGSPFNKDLKEYCETHNVKVSYVYGDMDNYHNLDADFYLTSSINDNVQNYQMVLPLKVYGNYFAAHRDNKELIKGITETFNKLIAADAALLSDLYNLYYSASTLTDRFLTREEAELLKGKTFTVGYASNHVPYTFQDDNGSASGVNIAILNMLAKEYGFNVEYSPYEVAKGQQMNNHYDILVSLLGNYSSEQMNYTLTDSYAEEALYLMVLRTGMEDYTLGMIDYLTLDKQALIADYPQYTIKFYENTWDFFNGYLKGEIEGAIVMQSSVDFITPLVSDQDVMLEATEHSVYFRYFVSKELNNSYVNIFNIIFNRLNREELSGIMTTEVFSALPDPSFLVLVKSYALKIGFFIVLAIAVLAYILFRQEMRKRQAVMKLMDFDPITGHMSYSKFVRLATERLKTAEVGQYEILSCDIDLFRRINTYYGIEKGNEILKVASDSLNEYLNDKDSIFAREHIDHFVILYGGKRDMIERKTIVYNVISRIAKTIGGTYSISLSLGSYVIKNTADPFNYMVDLADSARLQGKKDYKTTLCDFNEELEESFETKLKITHGMRQALKNEDFYVMYQPKIDFETHEIAGAEALIRWQYEEGVSMYPDMFIPEFEQNGFIVELDLYVLEKVCQCIKRNSCELLRGEKTIAVNLSAVTLMEQDVVIKILSVVDKYEIDPKYIELEITESAMVAEEAEIIARFNELKIHGFSIALDDFGAGLSSLNRLGALNADVLKMDKSFLGFTTDGNKNEIIVANTIKLSKQLGMKVVAEGVETEQQVEWLKELGCDIAQGYYYEKPMTEDAIVELLKQNKTYK